ncbi:MAG: TetR family transcriptional regulator [Desertimonas sp.]
MGRPPIIVKERVAEVTLRLIDEEGLEAVSIERIATELGVRGPSLYHHFEDKAAILTEVARLVLGNLDLEREVEDWREWLIGTSVTVYRRVLEHPRAAVILLEHLPKASMTPAFGMVAERLTAEGIDPSLHILLMEGSEKIAWGWAMQRAVASLHADRLTERAIGDRWPELVTAVRQNPWDDESLVEASLRGFIRGVVDGTTEGDTSANLHGLAPVARGKSKTAKTAKTASSKAKPATATSTRKKATTTKPATARHPRGATRKVRR